MTERIRIIGAGLAGAEAAWQCARRGIGVDLWEMRPSRTTPAHQTADFAELVCSNSLKSDSENTAPWLLKQEMRRAGSLLLEIARRTAVPAGHALAVDRCDLRPRRDGDHHSRTADHRSPRGSHAHRRGAGDHHHRQRAAYLRCAGRRDRAALCPKRRKSGIARGPREHPKRRKCGVARGPRGCQPIGVDNGLPPVFL